VSGRTAVDRKSRRRQETTDEILAAAWEIVREKGLAGLSLRELGDRVGMRAQSLYSYFASKHEIYDAMFAAGYREALAAVDTATDGIDDPLERLRRGNRHFFRFCVSDRPRYQLLFQRTIPDFEPSPTSYALAVEFRSRLEGALVAIGIDDRAQHDLWTAVITGMTDQQLSNDPDGDRWEQLLDEAIDMMLDHLCPGWRERNRP
jgi:AcrR family transcriptional regulator